MTSAAPCAPRCDCTPGDAIRWFALLREAAGDGDGDLQALLPAVRDHADLVTAAYAASNTTVVTVPNTNMDMTADITISTDTPEDDPKIMAVSDIDITGAPATANPHS